MAFIISPYAISFDSIKTELQKYATSKPENQTWKDYYASGAGETLIEIAAALGAFYAYHIITNRRESYISTAQTYSSVIGLAQNLGYSAKRGHNLQLRIPIVAAKTASLPRWTVLGSYGEYDVVLLDDTDITQNQNAVLNVVIGNSMAQGINITTDNITQFTFSNPDVTDDCRLFLNDNIVLPVSNRIKDAINDKYVMLTNTLGAVDVFYLQGRFTTLYKVVNNQMLYQVQYTDRDDNIVYGYTPSVGNQGEMMSSTTILYTDTSLSSMISFVGVPPVCTYTGVTVPYEYNTQLNSSLAMEGWTPVQLSGFRNGDAVPFATYTEDGVSSPSLSSKADKIPIFTSVQCDVELNNNKCWTYTGETQRYLYSYKSGDTLYLQFIARNNLKWENFKQTALELGEYASEVNQVTLIEDSLTPEEIDDVKTNAPIYHETSGLIRSRKDYSKYLKLAHPSLIDANDKDIFPGLIAVTYLKKDFSFMLDSEKETWINNIEETRPSGVAHAIIEDPMLVSKTLTIQLWLQDDDTLDVNYQDKIKEIGSKYTDKLQPELDLHQIEHDIENISGIKVARVSVTQTSYDYSTDTYVPLAAVISVTIMVSGVPTEVSFYCSSFNYYTGSVAPTWPTATDESVIDGQIIWKKVNEYIGITTKSWSAQTVFQLWDYIIVDGVVYQCVGFINLTGSNEPTWGNELVYDGNIIWRKINYSSSTSWIANHNFNLGQIIAVTVDEVSTLYYQCVSFRGLTGSTTPTWTEVENGVVVDNQVNWSVMSQSDEGKFIVGWNKYLQLDYAIRIES